MLAEISDRMKAIARGCLANARRPVRVPSFYLSIFTLVCLVEARGKAWGSHSRCTLCASFLRLLGQQLTITLPEQSSRAVRTWNEP